MVPAKTTLRRSPTGASRGNSVKRLLDRKRFSGQRRFVALERMNFREARVRRYAVAGLQQHDVARGRARATECATPTPSRSTVIVGASMLLQRIEGIVGAVFLHEARARRRTARSRR